MCCVGLTTTTTKREKNFFLLNEKLHENDYVLNLLRDQFNSCIKVQLCCISLTLYCTRRAGQKRKKIVNLNKRNEFGSFFSHSIVKIDAYKRRPQNKHHTTTHIVPKRSQTNTKKNAMYLNTLI